MLSGRFLAIVCLATPHVVAQTALPDPNYQSLRNAQLTESFVVENVVLKRDAGEFRLKSGTISFGPAVLGRITMGVFVGQGEFRLNPAVVDEAIYMASIFGVDNLQESFARAVFYFTDESDKELKVAAAAGPVPADANNALRDIRGKLRQRRNARSTVEGLLTGEDMDNVEADLLADLYRSTPTGVFNAYITGSKYKDLRFFLRPGGAVPQMSSPEEVGLINYNPGNEDEGVWYLAHRAGEYRNGQARSDENKWLVDVQQYRIETQVAGNERLTAKTSIDFKALVDGARVIKFGLLPTLRVSAVRAGDQAIPFIQESRDQDGSFYVILPEPLVKDRDYSLTVEYAGDKVVRDAGGGNFSIGARTSWYPSMNSFGDQAKYSLTFRIPRQYTLVSVGKPVSEKRDGDFMVSEWMSDVPLAVAGFNYGRFKKKEQKVEQISYDVESYAASSVPDYLKPFADAMGGMSPTRMSDQAMLQGSVAMRIYTQFFGAAPYGRLALTQQPEFSFGQSWPGLVYLPMAAFLDSTTRWQLFDDIDRNLNNFVEEVTPHEVAHQWWGHMVGWSSYRDQWLSEGFADFSAGLFLQLTEQKQDRYFKFLDTARDNILNKNSFGFSANDAGPLHMGQRLNTPRTSSAYNNLIYSKGAYILHMIRRMMYDGRTGDQAFIQMMQDFVQTHLHKNASTESFQAVVEKHMTPGMNLTNDGKMDWFFDEWVRGTDVPRYDFQYDIKEEGGKYRLTAALTQSGVGDTFRMPVPIYVELDNGNMGRLGSVFVTGNATNSELSVLLEFKPKRVFINGLRDVLTQK